MMAVALSLRDRGHEIVFATADLYRTRIESLGLKFHAIRPDLPQDPEQIAQMMDPRIGTERILKDLILRNLRETYDDLMAIAKDADFLVAHEIIYAAPVVAEVLKQRWASCVLAPASFFSAYEPIVTSVYPALSNVHRLGTGVNRWVIKFAQSVTRSWGEPVYQLRQELGLRSIQNPIVGNDKFSPYLVLALFSSVFAPPQPDWPPNTLTTGFTFYDGHQEQPMMPELLAFLEAGDPPLVFTLGSAAVHDAGDFYTESILAAFRLDRRAVLLMGQNPLPAKLPTSIFACSYAPYSEIFPRACAIVHQGGIGTTAQGLRSGHPTLVMPYSHDQPDNAARLERLGVSRTIPRHAYRGDRLVKELRSLLENPQYQEKAAQVSQIIQTEKGVLAACDAIEQQFS
jgi:UDP:flavonoid glycosyltransferase YjiC (YdhE family)